MSIPNLSTQGNYLGTFGGLNTGFTDEGWFFEIIHKGEMLRFEEFGQNVVDYIRLGADVFVEAVLKDWNAAALQAILWPYSTDFGNMDCPAGQFASETGAPLILSARPCSHAGGSDGGPASITFHNAVFEPEVAARINLNNQTRTVPVRFRILLCDINPSTGVSDPIYSFFSVA